MLVHLNAVIDDSQALKLGNKAKNLMNLVQNGFEVPDAVILNSDIYEDFLENAKIKQEIEKTLKGLNTDFIEQTSTKLRNLIGNQGLNPDITAQIEKFISPEKSYAVRSSSLLEDGDLFSFAGLYESFLQLKGIDEIMASIIKCYQSLFSVRILQYAKDNDMDFAKLKMAVIVQEMVNSNYSGVAFTVNPISGVDGEILIEIVEGLGENLVSGKVNPRQYVYNWKSDSCEKNELHVFEDRGADFKLRSMTNTFLQIQQLYGYPCDIEFAIESGKLYILQVRAITKLQYNGIVDLWSTADFKDGGVSAGVCTPFMWSLYEYIWNHSLSDFVIKSKILPARDCQKPLGEMFYGRPYWNLSFVKKAMSQIPGYKERDFDSTYGIKMNYEGDGDTTGISISSLWRILKIAIAQNKILKERQATAQSMKEKLLKRYEDYKSNLENINTLEDMQRIWYTLTHDDYLESESFYFWQIFINTVHQSLNKDKLTKYVSNSEYLGLMSGINDISHLRPFYEIWELSRKIRSDSSAYKYWTESSLEHIREQINCDHPYMYQIADFIQRFGYHSDKELDVTYPCYMEDEISVIKMIRDNVLLDDSCSPILDKSRQAQLFAQNLEILRSKVSDKKYQKLKLTIERMRKMLWWREEFRDLSTMLYYIIRIYSLKLANFYAEAGILADVFDIWYLKIADLWEYIDGKLGKDELHSIIEKNKSYYNSFRNYHSENEIGAGISTPNSEEKLENKLNSKNSLSGLGCNSGIITARVKVIRDMSEMDKLEVGDILVTKFTDTGWTSKFALLAGIITEYGGVLCHAAIVSREYGIPCIVAAEHATSKIPDGSFVQMNGETGQITIMEEA